MAYKRTNNRFDYILTKDFINLESYYFNFRTMQIPDSYVPFLYYMLQL